MGVEREKKSQIYFASFGFIWRTTYLLYTGTEVNYLCCCLSMFVAYVDVLFITITFREAWLVRLDANMTRERVKVRPDSVRFHLLSS